MAKQRSVFRLVDTDVYEATIAAAGPWSESHCHGGAPAALLASALEDLPAPVPMDVARFTVDLLRPVPIGVPLRIVIEEAQQGRTARVATAELVADYVTVAKASGLRVRSLPAAERLPEYDLPDEANHRPMPGGFSEQFTIVPVSGGFGQLGPADVWFRLNTPLLVDAGVSPTARCAAAADFGSGVGHELAFDAWQFPSLDLTISISRPPLGDWILLKSRWLDAEGGRTSCVTALADLCGPFGSAIQTVLINPRRHQ